MWETIFTVLVIAIASNLDNAGVGIAYGARNISISWLANGLIALISGVATELAGATGTVLSHYISTRVAAWAGGLVMLAVGLWVFSEPWRTALRQHRADDVGETSEGVVRKILRDPVAADFDRSQTISLKEASILGIALALNALAGGFDAGAVHIGVTVTAVAVTLVSFLLLGTTAYLGRRYAASVLGDRATYVAGLLLIIIGVHQIW